MEAAARPGVRVEKWWWEQEGMCLPEERVEEEEGRLGGVDVGATDGPERHRGDNVTYHHKNRDRAY